MFHAYLKAANKVADVRLNAEKIGVEQLHPTDLETAETNLSSVTALNDTLSHISLDNRYEKMT